MFNNLINNIQNKLKTIQEETDLYNNVLSSCSILSNLNQFPTITNKDSLINETDLLNICPDLHKERAKLILDFLPLDELYIQVFYSKECKTNKEYFIMTTTKYLWFISNEGYLIYPYDNFRCTIIKNKFMSKIIKLANFLFEITGTEETITYFINFINDLNFRTTEITNKSNTLCGIIPAYRLINDINSGITLDNSYNIVFHSKEFNYKYNINDIINYELLLDDSCIFEKKNMSKARLTSTKNSCSRMSLRVTTKDNVFTIPILKEGSFQQTYQATSTTYINSINFARTIIDKLNELKDQCIYKQ